MPERKKDFVEEFKVMDDDRERFVRAVENAKRRNEKYAAESGGIGTLAEKTIHAALKNYFADESEQEIKVGDFYADAKTSEGIFEIQTRQFFKMKRKLSAFLPENRVCIVYPVKYRRTINWVDEQSGELHEGKMWNVRDRGYDIFFELYGIREFLRDPNLNICLMYLHSEEYKSLNGYGKNRKIRASRIDGIPTELYAEINLCAPEDFLIFVPEKIRQAEEFTRAEFAAEAHIHKDMVSYVLGILKELGLAKEGGKRGRMKTYRLILAGENRI